MGHDVYLESRGEFAAWDRRIIPHPQERDIGAMKHFDFVYAPLWKVTCKGRVIGVDIGLLPHNRAVIENHELYPWITLVEGSSVAPETVRRVKDLMGPSEIAFVILDSCHTKEHVAAELEEYCDLVTSGSYLVATDGSMKDLYDMPRGRPNWKSDNLMAVAVAFVDRHPQFEIEEPQWPFNESELTSNITDWPGSGLRSRK